LLLRFLPIITSPNFGLEVARLLHLWWRGNANASIVQ
jgi:hypothetical protein